MWTPTLCQAQSLHFWGSWSGNPGLSSVLSLGCHQGQEESLSWPDQPDYPKQPKPFFFFFKEPVSWLSRQWRWLCKPGDLRSSSGAHKKVEERSSSTKLSSDQRAYAMACAPPHRNQHNQRSRLAWELQRARCPATSHASQRTPLNGTSKEVLEAWLMTAT